MSKLKNMLQLVFHGPYDTGTKEGRSKERARNIALTAITALIAKLVAMATPLITVRITLSYMGEEVYGLWTTVSSFFAMFAFADLGLGSGLQTELSRMTALDDGEKCKKLVSSCYALLCVVSITLLMIFGVLYPIVNWSSLINATTEQAMLLAGGVVAAIVITKILNVPLALIQRAQMAMQEGYRSNLWQCSGNLLSLVFVIVISRLDLGVLTMVWASSLITVIVSSMNMVVYFWKQRPELCPSLKYFDMSLSQKLLKTGVAFLVLSIFTSISLSIDNFIVAHVNNLTEVTSYSIMYKIASLISVVSAMLSTPMWSANGEALERGDIKWVKTATNKIMLISFGLSAVASLGMFVLIKPALWILTDGIVHPDYLLLTGMCLFQIIVSITNPYFMILNGAGIVKFQIINYVVFAIISLPMKYLLGQTIGMVVIPWAGLVCYFLTLTIPTYVRSQQYLRERR